MIVVTGAAGFIGSCVVGLLNQRGVTDVVLVDDFSSEAKKANWENKHYHSTVPRMEFEAWMNEHGKDVSTIVHIGARTDTTEFDAEIFEKLNVAYTKMVWKKAIEFDCTMIYASSAATYGLGELGYDDNEATMPKLQPLNPYGWSKQWFDMWALEQKETPKHWYGLKFFNVYGPNEYHKGRMASVIFHTYNQVSANGEMKLFRSHNPNYTDGGQMRDFVYVKDVISVIEFLMTGKAKSGIYNLGSGKARTFLDLATNTFKAMGLEPLISFVDTPEDIRDKYQYFTEANMQKLIDQGYDVPFHSLEEGVHDYVTNYLTSHSYL